MPEIAPLNVNLFDDFEDAARTHAYARIEEMRLEDERHIAKSAAISRILQTPNEHTGKAHSVTSAEAIVQLDPGYRDYLKRCRDAVLHTMLTGVERDVRYARMMAHANGGVK